MLEPMVKSIYGVGKRDSVKPKRGQKDKTVIAKIQCALDPGIGEEEFSLLWNAIVKWKEGGIKKEMYVSGMLGDLVMQIVKRVKDILIDLKGKVQEVDVIFKMPSGKDHKLTATYKAAIRSI